MTISHSILLAAQQGPRRVASPMAMWLGGCLLLGMALIAFQDTFARAIASVGILFLLKWAIGRRMKVWQGMMLISLTGFIILNYGFENFIAGHIAGYPLLIGEMLMCASSDSGFWQRFI